MSSKNIEEKIQELIISKINSLGYEIYDIIYEKEVKNYYLRIFIDSKNGITINDCEKVNNEITDLLDEADYIKEQYFLEISSPGIERRLRKEKHFLDNIGKKVYIKTYSKLLNGKKEVEGILEEYNKDYLLLKNAEKIIKIEKNNIAVAKTIFDW